MCAISATVGFLAISQMWAGRVQSTTLGGGGGWGGGQLLRVIIAVFDTLCNRYCYLRLIYSLLTRKIEEIKYVCTLRLNSLL
jgi:hypothetical protein